MASATPGAATNASNSQADVKKKARPNPARRKASKAKDGIVKTGSQNISDASIPKQSASKGNCEVQATRTKTKQAARNVGKPTAVALAKRANVAPASIGTSRHDSRHESPSARHTSQNQKSNTSIALATPALVTGGLMGCAAGAFALLGAGLWRSAGSVDSAVLAVRTARLCMDNLCEEIITSLKSGTYNTPEALDMLRRTTLAYASAVPGGAPMVERIFREVDMIRKQRGREVDRMVLETCSDLSKASARSAGPTELQTIILRNLGKLSKFVTDASQDVLARNPNLKTSDDNPANGAKKATTTKAPTVELNMAIRHRHTTVAA